jgi:hypothetical protein
MDNQEKLVTLGIQDKEKQNKNTTKRKQRILLLALNL